MQSNKQGSKIKRVRKKIKTICYYCETEFMCELQTYKKHENNYCSQSCVAKQKHKYINQKGENNPNWKNGRSKNNYYYKKRQKEKYPERIYAREKISKAIKSGKLERMPCIRCGSIIAEAHHENYSNPLSVIWLCKIHHKQLHRFNSLSVE